MKKATLSILLLACFTMLSMSQTYNEKGSIELFQQGMSAYKTGQYDFAKAAFQKAINYDPGNGLSYYYLGLSEVKLKEYSEALDMLGKAQNIDPTLSNNVEFNMAMGLTHAGLGNYPLAEKYLRTAIKQDATSAEAYYNLATQVYMQGYNDTIHANALLDTCMSIDPKMVNQFINIALQYEQLGDNSSAIKQYERILKQANTPLVNFNLARLYYKEKQYNQAIALYQRVIELSANDPKTTTTALLAIGNAYSKLENYPEAINYFNQALEITPNNNNALLGLGNAYYQTDNTEMAMQMFQQAADNGSIDARNWMNYYKQLEEIADSTANIETQTSLPE